MFLLHSTHDGEVQQYLTLPTRPLHWPSHGEKLQLRQYQTATVNHGSGTAQVFASIFFCFHLEQHCPNPSQRAVSLKEAMMEREQKRAVEQPTISFSIDSNSTFLTQCKVKTEKSQLSFNENRKSSSVVYRPQDILEIPVRTPGKVTPKFICISTVVISSDFPETEVFLEIEYSIPPFSKVLIDFCLDLTGYLTF